MATSWAQTALAKLYNRVWDDKERLKALQFTESTLIDILDNLLTRRVPPVDSAAKSASFITSQVDAPFGNLLGVYFSAIENSTDDADLQILVGYIVALARLPNAVNKGPETMTVDMGGFFKKIYPGEEIILERKKRLWRDLPGLSMVITESFQGPEAYLYHKESPESAKKKWRNINTWLALLATCQAAQDISALSEKTRLAFKTFVLALEFAPGTMIGDNVDLHVPAAAQWFRIAGDAIEKLCEEGTENFNDGSWFQKHGRDQCDNRRLEFWKERMLELGYDSASLSKTNNIIGT